MARLIHNPGLAVVSYPASHQQVESLEELRETLGVESTAGQNAAWTLYIKLKASQPNLLVQADLCYNHAERTATGGYAVAACDYTGVWSCSLGNLSLFAAYLAGLPQLVTMYPAYVLDIGPDGWAKTQPAYDGITPVLTGSSSLISLAQANLLALSADSVYGEEVVSIQYDDVDYDDNDWRTYLTGLKALFSEISSAATTAETPVGAYSVTAKTPSVLRFNKPAVTKMARPRSVYVV